MEIVNEFTGKKYGYDFLINADLQKLFTYLIRIWISEGYTIPKRQVPKYELSFDEITEYINYHYYEDLKQKNWQRCAIWHIPPFPAISANDTEEAVKNISIT